VGKGSGRQMTWVLELSMADFVSTLKELLGKAVSDPGIEPFFQAFNITERPELPRGDMCTYVGDSSRGFSLILTDQPFVGNPRFKDKKKKGILLLTGCHFYSQGYEGYQAFAGPLPCGLAFQDTRKEVLEKLGPSSWQAEHAGTVLRERWEHGDLQLNVTYFTNTGSIATIYFGIREFFAKEVACPLLAALQ
jgi:hypothetical protein